MRWVVTALTGGDDQALTTGEGCGVPIHRSAAGLEQMFRGTLSDALGMRVAEVDSDRVVMTHPAVATTADLHAVTAILAESAGSAVAVLAAAPRDAVGVELSITHYPRAAVGGITAVATLLAATGDVLACAISISDAAGSPLAEARLQCMARDPRRVTPAEQAAGWRQAPRRRAPPRPPGAPW